MPLRKTYSDDVLQMDFTISHPVVQQVAYVAQETIFAFGGLGPWEIDVLLVPPDKA